MYLNKDGTIKESVIQKQVFQWVRHTIPKPMRDCIFSIQNEGKRSLKRGAISKAMGLMSGVSDIFIMIPRQGYHGAFIELKSTNGKLSPAQSSFLERATEQGYFTQVCNSYDKAVETIMKYLEI